MADIYDVIADATRRDILQVLRERHDPDAAADEGGTSVSEIVAALGFSQPTVSKHLKVLREAGLVSVREDGQHRYYRLEPEPLEQVEDWLIPFLSLDVDVDADAMVLARGLPEQARQVADAIGSVAAGASHRVASAVHSVSKKLSKG
ncbi:ArsR/SmtB family transcription factor [Okibacterium endophyticum]